MADNNCTGNNYPMGRCHVGFVLSLTFLAKVVITLSYFKVSYTINQNDSSPQHNAILRVTPQLVEYLQINQTYLFRLRDHLFDKKFISESDYVALDQFSSTAERADYLTRVIAERIGDCDRQFYELINSLELVGSEKWAQDILKILYTARDTLTQVMSEAHLHQ